MFTKFFTRQCDTFPRDTVAASFVMISCLNANFVRSERENVFDSEVGATATFDDFHDLPFERIFAKRGFVVQKMRKCCLNSEILQNSIRVL